MEKTFGQNDPKILSYFEETFEPEDSVLKEVRARSEREGLPSIHVASTDGLHLEVLTRALGAKKAVEIGTLAGYSGICIARALPADGKLYTFDIEEKHVRVAGESFAKAGVAEKIEMFVGPAVENLARIVDHGPFDLVFIDADKVGYPSYLAWATEHLRVGGAILADNTFGWGMIADQAFSDEEDRQAILALREFNREVARPGGRFRSTILPTGEGLTLAVKLR